MPRTGAPEITVGRSPFQGVTQIVRYNWPYYVVAAAAIFIGGRIIEKFGPSLAASAIFGIFVVIPTIFWVFSSIVVSFYVYDLSLLYRWEWLREVVRQTPRKWVSFHAGLDEASEAIRQLFPGSEGTAIDIYDPERMKEPSIERARRSFGPLDAWADFRALPFPDSEHDIVFLILAAHELRREEDRIQFFKELRRILVPEGQIILVEHLRDAWNFAAYGPAVRHFFSRREWLQVAAKAGLTAGSERSLTPFVRCFAFIKKSGT